MRNFIVEEKIMENKNNSNVGFAILFGALILFAFSNARADVPRGTQEKLLWADECPDPNYHYDEKCKKKVYIDETIEEKDLSWQEIEKIARREFSEKNKIFKIFRDKFSKTKIGD